MLATSEAVNREIFRGAASSGIWFRLLQEILHLGPLSLIFWFGALSTPQPLLNPELLLQQELENENHSSLGHL